MSRSLQQQLGTVALIVPTSQPAWSCMSSTASPMPRAAGRMQLPKKPSLTCYVMVNYFIIREEYFGLLLPTSHS